MSGTAPNNHSSHCLSLGLQGGKRSSCCLCCDTAFNGLSPVDISLTPPLDNVYLDTDENQPFTCIYLLNLFLAPDMKRYLAETSFSDDVYKLPIHLQSFICEARMEVLLSKQRGRPGTDTALKRLDKIRVYVRSIAQNDTAVAIATLNEIIRDEDELLTILGE